jgi:hypothetical protein
MRQNSTLSKRIKTHRDKCDEFGVFFLSHFYVQNPTRNLRKCQRLKGGKTVSGCVAMTTGHSDLSVLFDIQMTDLSSCDTLFIFKANPMIILIIFIRTLSILAISLV